MKTLWVLALALGFSPVAYGYDVAPAPWAMGKSKPEDLTVSLVTFGPGDDVISWFGHTALIVQDNRLRHGRLYNYGMFSFDPTMLARFALGRLTFWVGEAGIQGTLDFYRELGRDVRLVELNLPPVQKAELAKALATNVLPENREYLYHHYFDNCATRPRDMIDSAIVGALKGATNKPGRMTLRDHTRRHAAQNPPMSVLLDFLMNDEIDSPITEWDEAFLPAELEKQVTRMVLAGANEPLVKNSSVFFKSSRAPIPEVPPALGPVLLVLGLLLGSMALALGLWSRHSEKAFRRGGGIFNMLVGLVFGLPGTALFVMWLVTDHTVTFRNENLFFANPLTLLALPLGLGLLRGSAKAVKRLARLWYVLAVMGLIGLTVKSLPLFNQDNWRIIGLVLPLNVGMAGALWLFSRATKEVENFSGAVNNAQSVSEG